MFFTLIYFFLFTFPRCHPIICFWPLIIVSHWSKCLCSISQAIFCAGYKAVLHIHAVVEECEIVDLMQQIDPKTRKPMKKKPLFVKKGGLIVCRVQVSFYTFCRILFLAC